MFWVAVFIVVPRYLATEALPRIKEVTLCIPEWVDCLRTQAGTDACSVLKYWPCLVSIESSEYRRPAVLRYGECDEAHSQVWIGAVGDFFVKRGQSLF